MSNSYRPLLFSNNNINYKFQYDPDTLKLKFKGEHQITKKRWLLKTKQSFKASDLMSVTPETVFDMFKITIAEEETDGFSIEYPTTPIKPKHSLKFVVNIKHELEEVCCHIDIILEPVDEDKVDILQRQMESLREENIAKTEQINKLELEVKNIKKHVERQDATIGITVQELQRQLTEHQNNSKIIVRGYNNQTYHFEQQLRKVTSGICGTMDLIHKTNRRILLLNEFKTKSEQFNQKIADDMTETNQRVSHIETTQANLEEKMDEFSDYDEAIKKSIEEVNENIIHNSEQWDKFSEQWGEFSGQYDEFLKEYQNWRKENGYVNSDKKE